MFLRIILFLLLTTSVFAQKEAINWYFGDHTGLDFTTTPPTMTLNSASNSNGGMAAISDSLGKLLFYTDGITIWDRDHKPMPNGFGLKGHRGLAQSALIVPTGQGIQKRFYVFTCDGNTYFNPAYPNDSVFAYSIVDMNLNDGKGDVTIKNQILISPVNESVAAVKHANGIDTWIVTHTVNSDAFYCYLVSKCGISDPIISHIGPVVQDGQLAFNLKFSPDGKKLSYIFGPGVQKQYLFNFNPALGQITTPFSLGDLSGFNPSSFSPNSRYLYTSGGVLPIGGQTNLNQYDLSASDIVGSLKTIADTAILGMQLGIDGKLYIIRLNHDYFIDVLHNPNDPLDQSNYQSAAYTLPGNGAQSFPNFIESYFEPGYTSTQPVYPAFKANRVCEGDSTSFTTHQTSSVQSFHWDFGELSSGSGNHSNLANPKHLYQKTGQYRVQCIFQNSICNDTLIQIIQVDSLPFVSLGNDIYRTTCNNEPIVLDAGKGFSSYLWQDNSTNQTLTVTNKGTYSVKVTNSCGSYTGSITIEKSSYSIPNLITPNNDNKNDQFEILTQGEKGKLSIYNSWGTEIYKNYFYDNSWDASNVGAGLYYYSYQLLDCPVNVGWVQVIK